MTVTTPAALLLLLVALPIVYYIGWPRSRFRRVRDGFSLGLRTIILVCLVLALAGVQVVQSADRLAVVYLVDVSSSIAATDDMTAVVTRDDPALQYIQQSLQSMRPDDQAGVVVFAETAQIARSMSNARQLGEIRTFPPPGNTDLSAAVRLALAMFPQDAARRIVVLSDGQPTLGDWQSAAQLAAAGGVEISYVRFRPPSVPEILVREVSVPTVLNEDQDFTMVVTIEAEQATRAEISVYSAGQLIDRQARDLSQGENRYSLRLNSGTSGFRDFEVRVEPVAGEGDAFRQNNRLSAFSQVEGVPRVLVVDGSHGAVDELRYLVPALEDVGLLVDVIQPGALPLTLDGLATYQAVVLANVPAPDLTPQRMQTLYTFVSDFGGGLVVVGGPESYGPGGYYQTPLEDALPVTMQIEDQERLPQLTIAYVIDRSGSMGQESPSGIPHIDLAKEAIIRSIDFLQPTDRAAVVSFDSDAIPIAQFQDVNDRTNLQRLVASLRASGGTSIIAGMRYVAERIVQEPSEIKHIILLTDGGAAQGNLVELVDDLRDGQNVTTSVITIGGFEAPFLAEMAEAGDGNYHIVPDADTIPSIFTAEAILATRTYIQEESFTPRQRNHPILRGIGGLPALEGYVTTTPRTTATVVLEGPDPYNDPIMAVWQFGLGRSVAFASDATSRWSQNWVGWEGFAPFWSQAVRWTITERASANLETRVLEQDGQARMIVDARDNDGDFLNGLDLRTNVIYSPEGSAQLVRLRQVAPGRYEGGFQPQGDGAYFLSVGDASAASDDPTLELSQTTGWVKSYSSEYDIRPLDEDVLAVMADLTGGTDLRDDPAAAFSATADPNPARVPIWPYLLILAIALLPLDIAARRLLITRSDLRRLRIWWRERALRRGEADEATAERLSTLKSARDRARAEMSDDESTAGRLRNLRRPPAMSQPPPAQPPGQMRFDRPPTPPPDPRPAPRFDADSGEGNIGSRLLKRRRRDNADDEADDA
jgi:uncharacterized membrane protein